MQEEKKISKKEARAKTMADARNEKFVAIKYNRERHDYLMKVLKFGHPAAHIKQLLDIIYERLSKSKFTEDHDSHRINGIIKEHLAGLWEKI